MANPRETSFVTLNGIPVHYDRDVGQYGTRGRPATFQCTRKLATTLDLCFKQLFQILPQGKAEVITTAGTIGDGEHAHGRGLAFDLDGFFWRDTKLVMNDFFGQKFLYLAINSHLYQHFSQVLNFYYPEHHDHFHVDFNFSFRYRPESNAQTFYVQACLKYIYDQELGRGGQHRDGVDGVHGSTTKAALARVLLQLGLSGNGGLSREENWRKFLEITRDKALQRMPHDAPVAQVTDRVLVPMM